MKFAVAFAALAATALVAAAPAKAADAEGPSFENGPVWTYGQILTKDGHFDDYMHWLATAWKAQEEALKKAGVILDYKVLLVDSPRTGEPDIILAQEYKNLTVMDASQADQYALQAKISGSLAKSNEAQAERGSIRTIMGTIMTREAILK
ncbi:MAG TPA: hypothetical protein VGI79_03930 [Caulobacteraceae bacterium]